ncbi:uncharacterized protein CTRU02_205698 [Colletotrichum truncatum]|uniref:Uncharacterized protein n=1 Tax=Colletotrichum truncatum TaxID=5467 RepID=A0ACC3Z4Q6_COLTU|nr:uncharacterized protein CTRU02_09450 [Colletotrichum truncatum]KAF6788642.1 hypothetical protein CTRU02_09450 [Colletotrichum truncatum]
MTTRFRVLKRAKRPDLARGRCRNRDVTDIHRQRESCTTPPMDPNGSLYTVCEDEGKWRGGEALRCYNQSSKCLRPFTIPHPNTPLAAFLALTH